MWCSGWVWTEVGLSFICGLWAGYVVNDGLGTAVIRGFYNTWVVLWPYGLLLFSMSFVISLCWDRGVCVSINSDVHLEQGINSAFMVWVLGNERLGISLYPGVIREHQVFVFRHLFFPSYFSYRSMQRLENQFIGKKPVCVVYIGSTWTRSVGILGMGPLWVSGGIRVLKALRVVIFLNSWPNSSGVLTILVTSAIMLRRFRILVLWGCTSLGDIRMEVIAVTVEPSQFGCLWSVLGGVCWGFERVSGDISGLFLAWVVILLNTIHYRPVNFFQSLLCFYFIGSLNLFYFFLVSLKGALTILATSAIIVGRLGFFVLLGCIAWGVIRKQVTTGVRTLFSFLCFCLKFLAPYSGNQTCIFWSSWIFLEPFLGLPLSLLSLFIGVGKGWLQFGLGLLEGCKSEWCWRFRFKGEILNIVLMRVMNKLLLGGLGGLRRVKGMLLLDIGAAGLVFGQFGSLGWARVQGNYQLSVYNVLWEGLEWGVLRSISVRLLGLWVWGEHCIFLKKRWIGKEGKLGTWSLVLKWCNRNRLVWKYCGNGV
ncbi:hypothetical protein HanPI659440_Chr14g0564301 [Helianthus annuus]|nr:hypothetical protein HanPI659440_Chr14g0564301 [Helianthus annuus]